VLLPHPAELRTIVGKEPPAKVQQHLVELSSLQVEFGCGMGAWALQGQLREALESTLDAEGEEYRWHHEDIDIPHPKTRGVDDC
jgi:hypothetical protein